MKKKTFVIAALIVVLSILATGTLAYYTTRAVAHNVITTGGIGITLVEDFSGSIPDGENTMKLGGVMPGTKTKKEVKVRNDEAEAWIRIRLEVSVSGTQQGLDADAVTDIAFNVGRDANQWTQRGEWFYYNSPVPQYGYTSALFSEVVFAGAEMGNEYQNAEFTVDVQAQAVQTANNGKTVLEAVGWPNS